MGSDASLLACLCDAILEGGDLTSFADKSLFLEKQKMEPVKSWESESKNIEDWGMFCHVFLGDTTIHPVTYEVYSLPKDTNYVGE